MSNDLYQGYQKPEIASLDDLKGLEVVRTEYTSSVFRPKVNINLSSISFNKACVLLLPGVQYVNILIDRDKKRIIVLPVNQFAKDAIRWCNIRDGEIRRRDCSAKKFGEKMYTMMEWIKENRYRVLAYYQEVDGVKLLVFNLMECEMVVPEFITLPSGKVVKRGRVILPGEWEGFGMPLAEHEKANEVELNAHYSLTEQDKEVTISQVQVEVAVPTDLETVQSHYHDEAPLQGVSANA